MIRLTSSQQTNWGTMSMFVWENVGQVTNLETILENKSFYSAPNLITSLWFALGLIQ